LDAVAKYDKHVLISAEDRDRLETVGDVGYEVESWIRAVLSPIKSRFYVEFRATAELNICTIRQTYCTNFLEIINGGLGIHTGFQKSVGDSSEKMFE